VPFNCDAKSTANRDVPVSVRANSLKISYEMLLPLPLPLLLFPFGPVLVSPEIAMWHLRGISIRGVQQFQSMSH